MTLTYDAMKSITRGAVSITEKDGFYRFERYAEEQKKAYEGTRQRSYLRVGATASVVLDFYTDSETLTFDYEIDRLNMVLADYMFFDIWEDDIMTFHIGEYSVEKMLSTAKIKLSKGEKRVRIFLPNIFKMNLSALTLDDGASFRPSKAKGRALILGDSITQGFDAHCPSMSYPNAIARNFDLDLVNQSIGGEVFLPDSLGSEPIFDADFITVAYGTNDWWSGSPDYGIAREYFRRLTRLYPSAKKFYISPIWLAADKEPEGKVSFYDAIAGFETCAREEGFTVIEGLKIMPHVTEMFSDGEHPNDLGFTEYAKNLTEKLRKHGVSFP